VIVPRAFWISLGAAGGVLVVRRLTAAARAVTPAALADRAGATAQGTGDSVRSWWDTVRTLAAEREVELREALGLDGSADAVDAHTFRDVPPTRDR